MNNAKKSCKFIGVKMVWCVVVFLMPVVVLFLAPTSLCAAQKDIFVFGDIGSDKTKFIEYSNSIKLSNEQERVKKEALSRISSPCCMKQTAGNCCSCDTAKSILGLSHYLIEKLKYDAHRVRKTVQQWVERVQFGGSSCGGVGKDECCRVSAVKSAYF